MVRELEKVTSYCRMIGSQGPDRGVKNGEWDMKWTSASILPMPQSPWAGHSLYSYLQ